MTTAYRLSKTRVFNLWCFTYVPASADPIIQDQTWPATVEDVLGQNGILDDVTYDSNEHGFDSMPMSFAQMNMEQWASENIDPQTSSVTPQPENNNKQVCFGMVRSISQLEYYR